MPRQHRIKAPDTIFHITARGNAQQEIFTSSFENRLFLRLLGRVINEHGWSCHAYCLMVNHYHLVLEISKENLSEGMHELNQRYAVMFNNLHDRIGHVFQSRFFSRIVTSDNYMMELVRYILMNPVRAGLVEHPGSWPWNCYGEFLSAVPVQGMINRDLTLSLFSGDVHLAEAAFAEYIEAACDKAFPWEAVREFLDGKTEKCVIRNSLSNIFSNPERQRNDQIAEAYYSNGYKLKEIAAFLGMSVSGVHKVLRPGSYAQK